MRTTIIFISIFLLLNIPLMAQETENERLRNAAMVLEEILNIPDNVPEELLDKAECVIIFPSVMKAAFGIGGSYGRGAITCRSGERFDGPWSAPAMFALEAVSFGFQLGGQATDFMLLVMNPRGAESVMSSNVKLGADASVAAGPKGRNLAAATDIVLNAEILSYSRSRGLFAGVSLEGSTLRSDGGANRNLYGRDLDAREIVREGVVGIPEAAKRMIDYLNTRSPQNLSN
jgi:SH3 domain-containing YSC84-like protein 1